MQWTGAAKPLLLCSRPAPHRNISQLFIMVVSFLKIAFAVLFLAFISTLELLLMPFHRTGKLFHSLSRFHSRWVLAVCGVKVVVEGLDNLDFTRSYIYVANHASFFDISAVVAGIPDQIRLVYKKELEKIPIFGWGLKYTKIYIDRKSTRLNSSHIQKSRMPSSA